ncbi:hypothetical protein JF535_12095 [Microbulbifer salipaludis]|uniref:Uncharacterized protein n=1 Tax=Microbulbifer salipaludis TaxID=187980 RepID=A0ABS3E8H9_9GAMM|nr:MULTISPECIES: hypothetical protein [Microbulbifer]MBN8431595.1 hypothetical protein [Microbulbifer salipaludis]MCK7596785.1 hypothetical protein [Microbulbifer sp. CAU 1566]
MGVSFDETLADGDAPGLLYYAMHPLPDTTQLHVALIEKGNADIHRGID